MRSALLVAVAALLLPALCAAYTPEALADQITNLPGLAEQPSFNQFAGYLTVDAANNRSIFYWYVESQNAPASDPLIWWSNGGPGCSGLLGFLTEHGPFRTAAGGGLEPFPFAWNRLANVLYVEAPAGVGFSFSDVASDYMTGDAQTARDNYAAIQAFLRKFPERAQTDLFISAESYGGHYVPTLAQVIVNENEAGSNPRLNFKGFLLGNPLTNMDENQNWGAGATICGHALASKRTCDAFAERCLTSQPNAAECTTAQSAVVSEAGQLDLYGLDFPTCSADRETRVLLHHLYMARKQEPGFSHKLKAQLDAIPTPYDPCEQSEETVYLNRADVRAALHVSDKAGQWMGCSNLVQYNQSDVAVPMEPIYTDLIARGKLQLVIFSGDDDSVCATLGTMHWMDQLFGTQVVDAWAPWHYDSEEYGQQIGGFVTQYEGISLVTVHGAGHMVSGYKPEKGFAILQNFLNGTFNTPSKKAHHAQRIKLVE